MILSGLGIKKAWESGNIVIDPFNEDCINPNSYDLHLGNELLVYERRELWVEKDNGCIPINIGSAWYRLDPGNIYLGTTVEWTETKHPWAPRIQGKSSLGRLGLGVHVTAGFGDVGFRGEWTLELEVVQPLYLKAGIPICQIYYTQLCGDPGIEYRGKYQDQKGPQEYRRDLK